MTLSPHRHNSPYAAMSVFAAAAARRPELWRTVLGLVLTGVLGMLVAIIGLVPVVVHYGEAATRRLADATMSAGTPPGVIGLLFSFLPILLGLCLTVLILMRRNPLGLLGPLGPFARCFLRVALPLAVLWAVLLPLTLLGTEVSVNLTPAQLIPWLPLALTGLVVQTLTEEAVFRGYLQQQLAARFASRWVWLVLPALMFGALHYSAAYTAPFAALTVLWAAAFGLAAADLTARSGNLGAALALHLTNNIAALLLVSTGGPLGGLALYRITPVGEGAALMYFAQDAVGLLVAWLLARLILRR